MSKRNVPDAVAPVFKRIHLETGIAREPPSTHTPEATPPPLYQTTPSASRLISFHHRDYTTPTLALPVRTDPLATIIFKLTALSPHLCTSNSIAILTTSLPPAKHAHLDPVGTALHLMSSDEKKNWNALISNRARRLSYLPVIDWTTATATTGSEGKSKTQTRFQRRAQALNSCYETDIITAANARWFTLNQVVHLPLIKAVDRVTTAVQLRGERSEDDVYKALVKEELACLEAVAEAGWEALVRGLVGLSEEAAEVLWRAAAEVRGVAEGVVGVVPKAALAQCLGRSFMEQVKRTSRGVVGDGLEEATEGVRVMMQVWRRIEEVVEEMRGTVNA